jgi:hypothetical protein
MHGEMSTMIIPKNDGQLHPRRMLDFQMHKTLQLESNVPGCLSL